MGLEEAVVTTGVSESAKAAQRLYQRVGFDWVDEHEYRSEDGRVLKETMLQRVVMIERPQNEPIMVEQPESPAG